MGAAKLLCILHQETARSVGEEHPLVWIEGDRVGPLDTTQPTSSPFGQLEEAAVCAVDVEPDLLAFGDLGDAFQRIDGPGVDRPGARHHHEWAEAARSVLVDRALQGFEVHS